MTPTVTREQARRTRAAGRRTDALRRRLLPFRVRLEVLNLRGLPRWLAEGRSMATTKATPAAAAAFEHVLAAHPSPLRRAGSPVPAALQQGKETNVRLAAERLDGIVVAPGQVFSHHHALGRPSAIRGYRRGLELRDGRESSGIGGGLCQVSNAMHWVAARAGMRIVERHRHGLDLFPDDRRTVPFGCGATVVYRTTDLRWQNPLAVPVLVRACAEDGAFVLELRTEVDPGIRVQVWEVDHRFVPDGQGWIRENRLRRRIIATDGTVVANEELAHNRGRVCYEPTPEQLACGEASPRPRS